MTDPRDQAPHRWKLPRRPGWALLLLAACTVVALALYAVALRNPFISDDKVIVAKNATLSPASLAGLKGIWTAHYWEQIGPGGQRIAVGPDHSLYRPVMMLSLWLNAALVKITPWKFRIVNVVLHAGAALAVGLWAAGWFGRAGGVAAAAVALLHPVTTDVINRIIGRADILAVLGVAAFLAEHRRAQKRGWTIWTVLRGALWAVVALGSKEAAAVVVPMAAIQEWAGRAPHLATSPPRPDQAAPPPLPRRWLGAAALGIPFVAYLTTRFLVVGWPSYQVDAGWDLLENPALRAGVLERVPVFFALACHYARLLVVPWPLIAFDVPAELPTWDDGAVWVGVIAIAAALIATGLLLRRRSAMAMGPAWWLCGLLIVGQLLAPIGAYAEVRLAYSMVPAAALAAAWAAARAARLRARWRLVAAAAGLTWCALAALIVVGRNRDHRTEVALLEADVRWRPTNAATFIRMANCYFEAGRLGEADAAFRRTVELAPRRSQGWYDLGVFYMQIGNPRKAMGCYRKAVEISPGHHKAAMNCGALALAAGNLEAAEAMLTAAERVVPQDPSIQFNFARLDLRLGRTDRARQRLEVARSDPSLVPMIDQILQQLSARPAPQTSSRPAG